MSKQQVLFARQPIYSTNLEVWAYELLFRASTDNTALFSNGDMASSQVMLNAFGEAGLEQVMGNKLSFINLTRNHLINLPPFNPQKFAIEVLENIEWDDEVKEAIRNARSQGYVLALDDQILNELDIDAMPMVDIIKIDISECDLNTWKDKLEQLKARGFKLLAEKVEVYDQFELCKSLGFDYFQGFFLARPQIIKGQKVSENRMVVFDLLRQLSNPDIDVQKLENVLAQDPQLCFKLLKLVNSAAFATVSKVNSIMQAIVLLGLSKIKSWANLVALGDLEEKPEALRLNSMIRAQMCKLLGQYVDKAHQDSFFTVGLFSMLDAFFDMPMEEVIAQLNLPQEFSDSIISQKGKLGLVLKIAIEHEQGHWGNLNWEELHSHGISPNIIDDCYIQSIKWAENNINIV